MEERTARLIYKAPGGQPYPVKIPPIAAVDYEIGIVRPNEPFEVPEAVAAHMLSARGNVNFHRYLEHGEDADELVPGERRVMAAAPVGSPPRVPIGMTHALGTFATTTLKDDSSAPPEAPAPEQNEEE